MKSIQSKILVVVISGLLVITAIVSTIAVNMTHDIMHKDADRILNNVAQKEGAKINDVLGDVSKSVAIMEHYATSEIQSLSDLQDPAFLEQYLKKTDLMFSEIALNTKSVAGFYLRLNPEYTTPTTGYYNLVTPDGSTKKMTVTDLSKYEKDDQQNVSWYYTPIQKGEATWLEPYYFPGYDEKLISYTAPLYVDSELLGVVGFDMSFGSLVKKIDELTVYDDGYAVLIGTDGKTAYNNQNRHSGKDPHTQASAELLNGMKLELVAEYKDIQKNIHPMLIKIVFAFLVVLFFAILYTVIVTHRITRPLKKLTAVAKELAEGTGEPDLSSIPVQSKDEIGSLSLVLKETIEKIREYTAYINALAYKDSLTGVRNSTAYAEAIEEINKEINHNNPQFAVLVADLNNLKETNDEYGHDVGNELIIHTAKLLTSIFKTSTVFRIGGDEFAVILKNTDLSEYHDLIAKFDEACAKDSIVISSKKLPVSIARGAASFDPEIDTVYQDVFAKADHAMYLNKQESKKKKS